MDNRILYIIQSTPYTSNWSQEAVDIVMAAAAFEIGISIVFADNGLLQLCPAQPGQGVRNLQNRWSLLEMYDVDKVYHFASSDRTQNYLTKIDNPKPIDQAQLQSLIALHKQIVTL